MGTSLGPVTWGYSYGAEVLRQVLRFSWFGGIEVIEASSTRFSFCPFMPHLQSLSTESSAGSMPPAEAMARAAGPRWGLCLSCIGSTDHPPGAGPGVPAAPADPLSAPNLRGEVVWMGQSL